MEEIRIDKWLWAARFFKSRTLAALACSGGKVDVNDQAAKPSKVVRAGDLLAITLPRGKRIVLVVALSDQRGGGAQAALLYEDLFDLFTMRACLMRDEDLSEELLRVVCDLLAGLRELDPPGLSPPSGVYLGLYNADMVRAAA